MFALIILVVIHIAIAAAVAFAFEYGHDLYLAVKYRKLNKIINTQPRIRY
jgi:hypothetical protein